MSKIRVKIVNIHLLNYVYTHIWSYKQSLMYIIHLHFKNIFIIIIIVIFAPLYLYYIYIYLFSLAPPVHLCVSGVNWSQIPCTRTHTWRIEADSQLFRCLQSNNFIKTILAVGKYNRHWSPFPVVLWTKQFTPKLLKLSVSYVGVIYVKVASWWLTGWTT